MHQKPIKKKAAFPFFAAFFITILLLFDSSAYAFHADSFRTETIQLNATVPIFLSTEIGLVNGQARELVYNEGKGQKISELRWEIDNVIMFGMKGSADFTNWFSVNGGIWTNLTSGDNGKMEDFDWDSGDRDWDYWSKSNISLNRAFIADCNAEFSLIDMDYINISGLLGFKFDNWHWDDSGGQYIYSKNGGWRNSQGHFPENQTGIIYEQWYYCPYIGIQTDSDFGDFKLKTYIKGTIFAWAKDEDQHLNTNTKYQDSFYNMKFIGAGISGSYSFTQNVFSTISFDYQKYFEQFGNTKVIDMNTGQIEKVGNGTGMDQESVYMSLSLGLRF